MEQSARNLESSFDPKVDTLEWRHAQRDRLLAFAKELEAAHGPVDPELRAEIRAKLASLDS